MLHKDHGRNLGGKAKGKVCTAIMYENIQNYETEINILQVRVNYREGGLYVIYSPEDALRPRAVYHIQPNFEVIN